MDKAFQIFHDTFDSKLLEFVPLKSAKNKTKTIPAWFDKLKNLRSKRKKAYRAFLQSFYWNKFNSCNGDSRQIYKLIIDMNSKVKTKENIPPLGNIVNENCQTLTEIANQLNDFFTSVAESLTKDIPKTPLPVIERVDKSMFLYDVTPAEIKCILNSLDNKSSSGNDYNSNLILKSVSQEIVPYMVNLINMSFRNGIFLSELKKSKSHSATQRGFQDGSK